MFKNLYQNPDNNNLLGQGDILDAEKLRDCFRGHQDYYADQSHFPNFIVLTQTCDLARGGVDFIFLAAVRKLINAFKYQQIENNDARKKNSSFIRDIYSHQYNKRGYFYLPCNIERGINEELVVDLRVMLSVHKMHYNSLLKARVCAISNLYVAQLGHIAGHMFNRVALPDLKFDPDKKANDLLKKQGEAYREARDKILTQAKKKCFSLDCENPASQIRLLPIFSPNQKLIYQDCALCETHAKKWDDERII